MAAPDNKDSKIYPLSYILLEVHVHFASSAHYGAGCYFDIRKGENLVVVVVVVVVVVIVVVVVVIVVVVVVIVIVVVVVVVLTDI